MNRKKFLTILASIIPAALIGSRVAAAAAVARENGTITEVNQFKPSDGRLNRDSGGNIPYENAPGFNPGDRVSFSIAVSGQVAIELSHTLVGGSAGDGDGDGGDDSGQDSGGD